MTAVTASGIERPPLKHTVKLEDDTEYEIKMSYGLFQDLQRVVPDATAIVDTILADAETRDYIVRRCMTATKKIVKDAEKELRAAEDLGLDDPDEINGLLEWATGHLLYFFATSAGGLKRLSEAFRAKLIPDQPAHLTPGSPS